MPKLAHAVVAADPDDCTRHPAKPNLPMRFSISRRAAGGDTHEGLAKVLRAACSNRTTSGFFSCPLNVASPSRAQVSGFRDGGKPASDPSESTPSEPLGAGLPGIGFQCLACSQEAKGFEE